MSLVQDVDLSETVSPNKKYSRSKIEHYKWTCTDKPGVFLEINKSLLHVDYAYQRRSVSTGKIDAIARNWSWLACGCLLVCLRKDGTYWVVDGQHRKMAAQKRSDIKDLPCLVFEGELIEEAKGFLGANTQRKPLTMINKINAMLTSGDPVAKALVEAVDAVGYQLVGGGHQHTIQCAGNLYKMFSKDAEVARKALQLMVSISDGECIQKSVLNGLFYLEMRLRANGEEQSIFDKHNVESIERIGVKKLKAKIDAVAAYHGSINERTTAMGIADKINEGRRSRRLIGFDGQAAARKQATP
jgi:hypothetical protein